MATVHGGFVSPCLAVALVILVVGTGPPPFHAHDGDVAGFYDAECPLLGLDSLPPAAGPATLPPLWNIEPPVLSTDGFWIAVVAVSSLTPSRPRSPPLGPR